MDRNERSRRHKQHVDVRSERRNAQQRGGQMQYKANSQSQKTRKTAETGRSGSSTGHRDHAPVFDQDHGRKPAAPQQKTSGKKQQVTKKSLRRRARRRRLLAVFLVLAAVVVGAAFSMTVLFKVTSITVQNPEGYIQQGAANSAAVVLPDETFTPEPTAPPDDAQGTGEQTDPEADGSVSAVQPEVTAVPTPTPEPEIPVDTGPYTQLQITSALGVQLGDNLFSFRPAEKEELMELALPLLEEIELVRKYPNSIVILVTPAVATWRTPIEGGWLVLSESFKVMEQVADQPQALKLLLCDAKAALPGTPLATLSYERLLAQAQSDAQQQAQSTGKDAEPVDPDSIRDENRVVLDELVAALAAAGILDRVTAIDVSNPEEIAFVYEGRICVLLGTTNQMDYKMQWATTILFNENGKGCSSTDMGVLDISHIRSDGTIQPVFRQGSYELPSQKVEEQPDADSTDSTTAADGGA